MRGQAPYFSVKPNLTALLERLLSNPHMVFPLLAEMYSIYYTVNRIVTKIRIEVFYKRMQVLRGNRASLQKESDGV